MNGIDELKKDTFFRLLEVAGRVFLLVRYSDRVSVGRRGFLDEEKKTGLVLVVNDKMKFNWEPGGLHVNLVFGTVPEKCYIPIEDIISIYSPEFKVQLVITPDDEATTAAADTVQPDKTSAEKSDKGDDDNVIQVNFKKPGR